MNGSSNDLVTALFAEHGQSILRFLTFKLGNKWEAEEISQETFLKFYSISNSETVTYPKSLLYKIAFNLALNRIRDNTTKRKAITLLEQTEVTIHDTITPEHCYEQNNRLYKMKTVIDNLPLRRREVFIRHKFYHQNYTRISIDMGISVSMVKKHMGLAMKSCLTELEQE